MQQMTMLIKYYLKNDIAKYHFLFIKILTSKKKYYIIIK